MHLLTALFLAAVLAGTALELWLSHRQAVAVLRHRDAVPAPFADAVPAAEHRKAADYTVAKVALGRAGTVLDAAVALALTVGGGIAAVDLLWRRFALAEPWLGLVVIATVLLLVSVVKLPLSAWHTFGVEARFGFNRTTLAVFLADLAKELLLAVALGGPLLIAVLFLMEHAGRTWWLWAFCLWFVFTLLIAWAWPTWFAPLFNRFSPLADPVLRDRIDSLLRRCGFTASGIFVADNSRRSAHGNAYFTGLGRNRRIVFFDTLLERLGHTEVEAVLAHELGHFRLHHVRQRLVVSIVVSFLGLALLGWLAAEPGFYAALGVPHPSTHAALLLFFLVAPAFMHFLTPVASMWSRRHEFAADSFATRHASPAALADALVKLHRDNASTLTPDPVYAAFHYSHPPPLARIRRLRAATPAAQGT